MRRWIVAFGVFSLLVANAGLANEKPAEIIEQLINEKLASASVGYVLMDLTDKNILLQQNQNKLFKPASTTKLFVSIAALAHLPDNYRFHTHLGSKFNAQQGDRLTGNLFVKFSGDPTLTTAELTHLFAELKAKGVNQIEGNIIIDDHDFSPPSRPDGYSLDDVHWYYAAPVMSANLDGNQMTLRIKAGKKIGDPIEVTALGKADWATIHNAVKTVSNKEAKQHCDFVAEVDYRNHVNLSGCWPVGRAVADKSIAINNPTLRAEQVVAAAIKTHDIKLKGNIVVGKSPKTVNVLASHVSDTIPALVKDLMKVSNNLYADALFKTLGKELLGQGSFMTGKLAVESILRDECKLDMKPIRVVDGSGSRYNLVSPNAIADLLYAGYQHPKIRDNLIDALPIAKYDGTLAWRFHQTPFNGKLIAKTGTMHDITSLSGYIWSANKNPYIFSIMINNVIIDIKRAKKIEEKIAQQMVSFVNAREAAQNTTKIPQSVQ